MQKISLEVSYSFKRLSSHWGSCKLVWKCGSYWPGCWRFPHTSYFRTDCPHSCGLKCTTCGCVRESLVGAVVWDDGACYNLSEVSSEAAGVLGNCVLQCLVLNRIYVSVSSYRFPRWVMPPRLLSWATTPVMTSSLGWYHRTPIRHRLWWILSGPCAGIMSPRWRRRGITERAAWMPSSRNLGKRVRECLHSIWQYFSDLFILPPNFVMQHRLYCSLLWPRTAHSDRKRLSKWKTNKTKKKATDHNICTGIYFIYLLYFIGLFE